MALQESGYRLALQGYQQFISGLGKISTESAKMGREMESAGKRVEAAGRAVTNAIARQSAALRNQERAHQNVTKAQMAYDNALSRAKAAADAFTATATKHAKGTDEYTRAAERANIATRNLTIAWIDKNNAVLTAQQTDERATQSQIDLNTAMEKYDKIVADAASATASSASILGELGVVLGALQLVIGLVVGAFQTMVDVVSKVYNAVKNLIEKGINLLVGAIKTLGNIANTVLKPIGDIFKTILGVAGGIALADMFRGIGQAFNDMLGDLKETLSYFQRLNIQLEALQARDIAKTGMSMGEAFFFAKGQAKDLLDWIIKLAVTTPFTVQQLSETLAMANAMGLNITMAKELTFAVGNFTAAMGLTEDHMFRIVYNFGQMLAQGKLNGREFRDLANSFVPVNQMLERMAAQVHKSKEEFKKLAFEGGVPVEAFFKEFIRMANEDFPGAMAKMARTFSGVVNNTKDFIQTVIGMNALGPVFDYITGKAADLLEKLLSPEVREAAENFGKILLRSFKELEVAFNRLWKSIGDVARALGISGLSFNKFAITVRVISFYISQAMTSLAEMIHQNARGIATTFQNLARQAMAWGYNIISMVARGMAAAAQLIAKVIRGIADMIAWFLSPGSPPKALPDLPKWGMAAMREYLEGFSMADFSALSAIQDPIKQALDIFARTGVFSEKQVGKIYKNLSVAIAKVIATGEGEAELMEMIRKKMGMFGQDIAKLAKLEIDLAHATEAVTAAEKALKEAQEAESRLRSKVAKEIRKYNDLLTQGADAAILNAQLAQINADEQAAAAATEQRIAAEEQLKSAQDLLDALKEQAELQEELVRQLLEITEAQIIEIETKVDTSGAAAALDDFSDMLGGWGEEEEKIFGGRVQRVYSPIRTKWDELQVEMAKKMQEAKKNWQTFWDDLAKSAEETGLTSAFENIGTAIDTFKTKWQELMAMLSGQEGRTPGGILFPRTTEPSNLDTIMAKMGEWKTTALEFAGHLGTIATNLWRIDAAVASLTGKDILGWLSAQLPWWIALIPGPMALATTIDYLTGQTAKFLEAADQVKQQLPEKLAGWVDAYHGKLAEIRLIIAAWVTEQAIEIQNGAINIYNILSAKWAEIKREIGAKIGEISRDIAAWVQEKTKTIENGMINIWNIITEKWESAKEEVKRITDLIKAKIQEIFETKATSIVEIIRTAIDSIKEFFEVTLPEAFTGFINGALATLKEKIDDLISKLKTAWDWLKKVFKGDETTEEPQPPEGSDQFGGRVKKGKAYIVGERGWEYFFPGVSGWIANQKQVAKMVNNSMRHFATLPRMSAQPVTSQNVLNFSMGGVAVYSPMTLAQVEAIVTNVIRREFS